MESINKNVCFLIFSQGGTLAYVTPATYTYLLTINYFQQTLIEKQKYINDIGIHGILNQNFIFLNLHITRCNINMCTGLIYGILRFLRDQVFNMLTI